MADTIRGKVTNIIDGDTFTMSVTHVGKNNEYDYGSSENIRLAGINAPEINTVAGKEAKKKLENQLSNKEVRVNVKSRDTYGRVVGIYQIV